MKRTSLIIIPLVLSLLACSTFMYSAPEVIRSYRYVVESEKTPNANDSEIEAYMRQSMGSVIFVEQSVVEDESGRAKILIQFEVDLDDTTGSESGFKAIVELKSPEDEFMWRSTGNIRGEFTQIDANGFAEKLWQDLQ